MATKPRTSASNICLIIVLYFLQGLNVGIAGSMRFFLAGRGVSWKDQGTFNFAFYPFALKLLWAPLLDVFYIGRFGRRKSWLVPVQLIMAGLFLFLSFYIRSFLTVSRIVSLTVVFMGITFLTATQDICVDGLAVSLFTATNPQWASTSQTVGMKLGRFLGYSCLLTFESANFTNRFIRKPLSLPSQPFGLFSLEQFIRFAALTFLVVTVCVAIFFRENPKAPIDKDEETNRLSLYETYLTILKLFKKKCMRQLTLASLLAPIGLAASNSMTRVALIGQGVPKENLALVDIPVAIVGFLAPIIIRRTQQPLTWYAKSYVVCLIIALPIAAYVYFTPGILSATYYYPLLIVILSCGGFVGALRYTAHIGFFVAISEPRIGATYITLLNTVSNVGFSVNSSIVLYSANWLPKRYAYVIAVIACTIFGVLWLGFSFRTLKRLQRLPTHEWYLKSETSADDAMMSIEQDENNHGELLVSNKEKEQDD